VALGLRDLGILRTQGWLPLCPDLPVRAIPFFCKTLHTSPEQQETMEQRRGNRTKAVLPVRIKGKDSSGKSFEAMAHTLDVNTGGVRLGSIRQELTVQDEITVFYRQRKMQFRVVWIKQMRGSSEFQVGLKALAQDKEGWGLGSNEAERASTPQLSPSHAAGLA